MKLSTFYRIEISAGLLYDATGKTICPDSRDTALAQIKRISCELFGGGTLINTSGIWADPVTGTVHNEPGISAVAVIAKGNKAQQKLILKAVEMFADVVKGTLGQSAVLVSISEVRAAFV